MIKLFEESKKIVKMPCIWMNHMIKCNALVRKRITAVTV